jgi:hypothetical protein
MRKFREGCNFCWLVVCLFDTSLYLCQVWDGTKEVGIWELRECRLEIPSSTYTNQQLPRLSSQLVESIWWGHLQTRIPWQGFQEAGVRSEQVHCDGIMPNLLFCLLKLTLSGISHPKRWSLTISRLRLQLLNCAEMTGDKQNSSARVSNAGQLQKMPSKSIRKDIEPLWSILIGREILYSIARHRTTSECSDWWRDNVQCRSTSNHFEALHLTAPCI